MIRNGPSFLFFQYNLMPNSNIPVVLICSSFLQLNMPTHIFKKNITSAGCYTNKLVIKYKITNYILSFLWYTGTYLILATYIMD